MKENPKDRAKDNASNADLRGRRRFLRATTAMAATVAGGLTALWEDEGRQPGAPLRPYGDRSPFEKTARRNSRPGPPGGTGTTLTPLESLYGIITPSALHFERHHSGVPLIDPDKHELLIHGLVEKPVVLKMEEIKRFPSVSRIHFLECSGSSAGEYQGDPAPTPQPTAGLFSCSEWTGVPLSTLLRESGVKPTAKWVLAEGGDASRNARSIPLEKVMDDVLVAYGQNGEAVRPEQGYPIRLIVPGWEGNINTKWLQRLHVLDHPAMTRDEAADHNDLLAHGKSYRFSFVMEAKSIVPRPAGGQHLAGSGAYEITGLAWSGRARVATVEDSTDGGKNWWKAELQQPVLKNAAVRFRLPWNWGGNEAVIGSRCTDAFRNGHS